MSITPTTDNSMKHDDDDFEICRIRKGGIEAVATGAVVTADISGDPSWGVESTVENSIGGLGVVTLYQMALTTLSLERDVRAGRITRRAQLKKALADGWTASKNNAVYVIAVSALLGFFPILGMPMTLLAIGGGVAMGAKLSRAFWGALTDEQQMNLRTAADDAGVRLDSIIHGGKPADGPASA